MGDMASWLDWLNGDPRTWLLEERDGAVRAQALRALYGGAVDDPEVRTARALGMEQEPIASILAAQAKEGYWDRPGAGYGPKYSGTVWNLTFLNQLGADGGDLRIEKACEYVLAHSPAANGGFGMSSSRELRLPPPSAVLHCLNGNLLRALIRFGWLDDPRVQRAIDWEARAITGEGFDGYYKSGTSGPGFCCAANEKQPCAWGAVKALLGLAAIPEGRRAPHVQRAIATGVEFLLSKDPAVADYPIPSYATKPNSSWFKFGFPSAYVTDMLQNLEVLCELGHGRDGRLVNARERLLSKQDAQGRWKNEYAYNGKTTVDIERQGQPSKRVTLRACRVLAAMGGPD
ncbi:MAG: nitrogen fixation protein NifH [Anaerolinea sp.]|nr:nitrogen fixation protein NifH [Anaerolinea sp.]